MLVRSDPFRQFDRFAEQVFGTAARPAAMPMDAWQAKATTSLSSSTCRASPRPASTWTWSETS